MSLDSIKEDTNSIERLKVESIAFALTSFDFIFVAQLFDNFCDNESIKFIITKKGARYCECHDYLLV